MTNYTSQTIVAMSFNLTMSYRSMNERLVLIPSLPLHSLFELSLASEVRRTQDTTAQSRSEVVIVKDLCRVLRACDQQRTTSHSTLSVVEGCLRFTDNFLVSPYTVKSGACCTCIHLLTSRFTVRSQSTLCGFSAVSHTTANGNKINHLWQSSWQLHNATYRRPVLRILQSQASPRSSLAFIRIFVSREPQADLNASCTKA
jgi:hypothetical protein